MNLGYLKKLRQEKGVSLQAMAEAVGLTTAGGYKRIEDGENRLTADRLPLIAKKLDVNPNELYQKIFFENELDERSSLKEETK